jgi:HD superfamily phosphohydrolase
MVHDNKVIHDPVWGTSLYYSWELQLLDSPLLQRLRNISQLGLAMLTYPSAHHTRFEHTLGVISVVNKMVTHINQEVKTPIIIKEDLYILRLAALLHDVGHCFCSHLSESIYGKMKEFEKLKMSFEIFESAKEHEIFAYIIVNTKAFKSFVAKKLDFKDFSPDIDTLFKNIGYMILGVMLPDTYNDDQKIWEKKCYMTQIVNGQYDADKLDYLRRDSYTAGLALTYDIDRFLYKIKIETVPKEIEGKTVLEKHLVIPVTGVSAVEEMAFSQLMLASYIYQHQKVLATDALIIDVVDGLQKNEKLKHPCDFLKYCDNDILGMYNENPDVDFKTKISGKNFDSNTTKKISDIVKRIKNRNLPKRAFTVNTSTVKDMEEQKTYPVNDIADRLINIEGLRNEICNKAIEISNNLPNELGGKQPIDIYDIHISIPKTSIAKDLSNALVVKYKTVNKEPKFVRLSDIVRLSDWVDAFAWHKWSAYVFSKSEVLPIVSIASKLIFEEYEIEFNEETVFSGIKETKKIYEILEYLNNNNIKL